MSFIKNTQGKAYLAGYFLANNEDCTRETREINASDGRVVTVGDGKYMPAGTIYPSNDGNAIGIVYEDVDVTLGNMPGSVVTEGVVYENKLPEIVAESAKTALKNIKFVTDSAVTRPY